MFTPAHLKKIFSSKKRNFDRIKTKNLREFENLLEVELNLLMNRMLMFECKHLRVGLESSSTSFVKRRPIQFVRVVRLQYFEREKVENRRTLFPDFLQRFEHFEFQRLCHIVQNDSN